MKVRISGKTIQCEKATKTSCTLSIVGGELDGTEYSGIVDWSRYELLEGEWSEPQPDPRDFAIAQLMRDVAALKGGVAVV